LLALAEDHAASQPQEVEQPAHGAAVALSQIIVDGDDVHALAGERVQVSGQGRDQRLAFAGTHFGDLALMQRQAADQLHVEVTHAQRADRAFAADGKGFGQDVVQGRAGREAIAEFLRLATQFIVAQFLNGRFQRIDLFDDHPVLFEQAVVAASKNFFQQIGNHLLYQHEARNGRYSAKTTADKTIRRGYLVRGRRQLIWCHSGRYSPLPGE